MGSHPDYQLGYAAGTNAASVEGHGFNLSYEAVRALSLTAYQALQGEVSWPRYRWGYYQGFLARWNELCHERFAQIRAANGW